ncbi:MAG TPA: 4'-phosphopantetheinyl transferase superfamily protein, partial [Acidimicrobiales bacterium]|nr:4'-phosphopantetheinyl transferase superfamily protein [Acidimicrobiales bacterium]
AARFAAKEAAMKALGLGLGGLRFCEVEVARDPSGAPRLRLHGQSAERARRRGVRGWRVSLTHTESLAQAVVLALGEGAVEG